MCSLRFSSAPSSMVLRVPTPWNDVSASQKTKELGLEVLGKDGAGISGVKGRKEQENLWSGLSLSAATMKLTAEGQGQNDSSFTGPGSPERPTTGPLPLASSQGPEGGTIPLPLGFQMVGLRPGERLSREQDGLPIWTLLAPRC